jgi:hypothetical protein
VLLFNALFTLERGFITNVYGLFSGHHFYILYVMFLKYALDLSFLVNVDMLCTDLFATTRLVYQIFKRDSITRVVSIVVFTLQAFA